MVPGICCNCRCRKYKMNFAQRRPYKGNKTMKYMKRVNKTMKYMKYKNYRHLIIVFRNIATIMTHASLKVHNITFTITYV